jgi:hypothetical protein
MWWQQLQSQDYRTLGIVWDITPCRPVVHIRFAWTYCFHFHGSRVKPSRCSHHGGPDAVSVAFVVGKLTVWHVLFLVHSFPLPIFILPNALSLSSVIRGCCSGSLTAWVPRDPSSLSLSLSLCSKREVGYSFAQKWLMHVVWSLPEQSIKYGYELRSTRNEKSHF